MQIPQNTINVSFPQNQLVPDEGPKAIPLYLNFANAAEFDLDMTLMMQYGFISMIQCLYIDNSAGTDPLTITVGVGTINQKIVAKPATQGYYAVLCPNPPKLSFVNASGTDLITVFLINAPVSGVVWATA
jgi:hypothetical protein